MMLIGIKDIWRIRWSVLNVKADLENSEGVGY